MYESKINISNSMAFKLLVSFMDANDIKAIEITKFRDNIVLGDFYFHQNDMYSAIKSYFSALKINNTHYNILLKIYMTFSSAKFHNADKKIMREICLFFLEQKNICHRYGFDNFLKFTIYYENKDYIKNSKLDKSYKFNDKLISILNDKVLQLILKKCLVVDSDLERFLTQIRKNLLEIHISKKKHIIKKIYKFLICLAEQCFFNEYIFKSSKKEEELISKVEQDLYKKRVIDEIDLLIISLYKPITSLNFLNNQLSLYQSKSKDFNSYLKFTFLNSKYENLLAYEIKEISKIKNEKSLLIKNQYEENPFPRWRTTSLSEKIDLKDFIYKQTSNHFIDYDLKKKKILIAGCGTGRQILNYSGINDANIFAIDISKTSLAYAKRMTDQYKIQNIKYFQTDLLNIDVLKESFDMIICTGVLHHMEKPLAGLKSLCKVLKPNGFMKLGLYSTIARVPIKDLRDDIKKLDLEFNKKNISKIREIILNSEDSTKNSFSKFNDFYSTSGIRDLIFNKIEHTFNLIEIKNIIFKQNLNFLGFGSFFRYLQRFKTYYPENNSELNLEYWNDFEINFPKTFTSMYDFWVSKI